VRGQIYEHVDVSNGRLLDTVCGTHTDGMQHSLHTDAIVGEATRVRDRLDIGQGEASRRIHVWFPRL
jgi:hypothetical protein